MIPLFVVFKRLWTAIRAAWQDAAFRGIFQLSAILLMVGTVFYWRIEHWSPLESLYFSVITLTTVGYGDFSPATGVGRAFTIGYVMLGLGVIIALVTQIAHHATQPAEGQDERG